MDRLRTVASIPRRPAITGGGLSSRFIVDCSMIISVILVITILLITVLF